MGRRRRESTVPPNPEVVAVVEQLQSQLDTFMASVGDKVLEYEENLKRMNETAAAEEARKVAARAANQSNTVITTKVTATKSLLAKAEEVVGTEAMEAMKPVAVADEGEGAEDLPPHYILELHMDQNLAVVRELQLLRQAATQLVGYLDNITDWLALSMPDLNEENSVVAEVLGAVLEQVASFVETVRAVSAYPKKYHSERAAIEKELLKLPESKALQMQLELNDAETWDEMEKSWKVLIRVCLITRSVLVKNLPTLEGRGEDQHSAARAALYM